MKKLPAPRLCLQRIAGFIKGGVIINDRALPSGTYDMVYRQSGHAHEDVTPRKFCQRLPVPGMGGSCSCGCDLRCNVMPPNPQYNAEPIIHFLAV
jgi:hypothetical protein